MDNNTQHISLSAMAKRLDTTTEVVRTLVVNNNFPHVKTGAFWGIPTYLESSLKPLVEQRQREIYATRLEFLAKARAVTAANPARRKRNSTKAVEFVAQQLRELNDRFARLESMLLGPSRHN